MLQHQTQLGLNPALALSPHYCIKQLHISTSADVSTFLAACLAGAEIQEIHNKFSASVLMDIRLRADLPGEYHELVDL